MPKLMCKQASPSEEGNEFQGRGDGAGSRSSEQARGKKEKNRRTREKLQAKETMRRPHTAPREDECGLGQSKITGLLLSGLLFLLWRSALEVWHAGHPVACLVCCCTRSVNARLPTEITEDDFKTRRQEDMVEYDRGLDELTSISF
ncbi:hypothetical protein CAC42_5237 [Sphaceloma murrayae]|uniref:Uncharacterized protein n=1 Tax=Sphaceloma murrayae TaxID=2082308 RepID=A0A2K1QUF0_9PEZI|nr:hypothetical protein CAC42_5237 [Sphaceloma murrayae]